MKTIYLTIIGDNFFHRRPSLFIQHAGCLFIARNIYSYFEITVQIWWSISYLRCIWENHLKRTYLYTAINIFGRSSGTNELVVGCVFSIHFNSIFNQSHGQDDIITISSAICIQVTVFGNRVSPDLFTPPRRRELRNNLRSGSRSTNSRTRTPACSCVMFKNTFIQLPTCLFFRNFRNFDILNVYKHRTRKPRVLNNTAYFLFSLYSEY